MTLANKRDRARHERKIHHAFENNIKVCAGYGAQDYDEGYIKFIIDDKAFVAWDSGVRTSCGIEDLEIV